MCLFYLGLAGYASSCGPLIEVKFLIWMARSVISSPIAIASDSANVNVGVAVRLSSYRLYTQSIYTGMQVP